MCCLRDGDPLSGPDQGPVLAEIARHSGDIPEANGAQAYWNRAQRAVYVNDRKFVPDSTGQTSVYDVSEAPNIQTRIDDAHAETGDVERYFSVPIVRRTRSRANGVSRS